MSDMKCPFCQQELLLSSYRDDGYQMWNCLSCQLCAQGKLWRELIRTRKALDIAKDALTTIGGYLDYNDCVGVALDATDDIYEVLEQKGE